MTKLTPRDKTTYIYALCEPDTGAVRYIGSSVAPLARLREHMSVVTNPALGEWFSTLKGRGESPDLCIIDEIAPGSEWAGIEKMWVLRGVAAGGLLNRTWHPDYKYPRTRWPWDPTTSSLRKEFTHDDAD